ncbi:helix-turn-helix domain-containing protein [Streptosporangium sp. CA-135522]|uniref:helix-turn-helix domain-containing protein n=1 Tax=Streptosporangium sp. CA-135522 TaxID=3240072 RepID=UPI003D8B28E8
MSARELAELLSELKLRSGRSYEALARRTGMSRSAVHRYCRGEIVPDTYGMVERIALACGASKGELTELYRLWARADARSGRGSAAGPAVQAHGQAHGQAYGTAGPAVRMPEEAYGTAGAAVRTEGSGGPEATAGGDGKDGREPGPAVPDPARGAVRPWTRRRGTLLGLVAAVIALIVSVPSASEPSSRAPRAVPRPPLPAQWVTGPAWSLPEAPVPRTLFGVTLNSATGAMPAFPVGAVRLWDSETRWAQIQPRRGEFNWSTLDRQVAGAEGAGLPVLFVMGGTPGWASPAGTRAPYPDDSRAAPPDALADWDTFVRALARRYRGRIEAYELWVLGNDRRFYTGSAETLVDMTRRASRIIRTVDRKAVVVCPGMGRLWTPEGQAVLRRFAELGGYDHCDVASVKLHQRVASDPPETMLELATTVDRVLHQAGVQPRLWSTGTTYSIPLQGSLDETRARDYAVRFFLVGLYARNVNLERMYFYNWGGTKIPIVLQAEEGVPTRAALAVAQLQRWLLHARSRSCGHGVAINLPENVWQCRFTIAEPHRRHHEATVRWAATGTADTSVTPGARSIRRLDGSTVPVRPGDVVTVTGEPILME